MRVRAQPAPAAAVALAAFDREFPPPFLLELALPPGVWCVSIVPTVSPETKPAPLPLRALCKAAGPAAAADAAHTRGVTNSSSSSKPASLYQIYW